MTWRTQRKLRLSWKATTALRKLGPWRSQDFRNQIQVQVPNQPKRQLARLSTQESADKALEPICHNTHRGTLKHQYNHKHNVHQHAQSLTKWTSSSNYQCRLLLIMPKQKINRGNLIPLYLTAHLSSLYLPAWVRKYNCSTNLLEHWAALMINRKKPWTTTTQSNSKRTQSRLPLFTNWDHQ